MVTAPKIKKKTGRRVASSDDDILADWDTGDYSKEHGGLKTQRDLAYKHKVSVAKINKMVKGREPKNHELVNNLIDAKQSLALQSKQSVQAVHDLVDERTKHINFFNDAALVNVRDSLAAPCDSQNDFKARAETIAKGREVVLGKAPDTAIQVNNTTTYNKIERVIVTRQ